MLVPVCHIYDEALDTTGCILSCNVLYYLQSVLDRFISCLALLWTGMSEGKSMLTTILPYITFVPMFYECEWPYNESPACEGAFVHNIIKTKVTCAWLQVWLALLTNRMRFLTMNTVLAMFEKWNSSINQMPNGLFTAVNWLVGHTRYILFNNFVLCIFINTCRIAYWNSSSSGVNNWVKFVRDLMAHLFLFFFFYLKHLQSK